MIGDFNSVLHAYEKSGGGNIDSRSSAKFAQCIYDCNLVDLGYRSPLFTYKLGPLRERLDIALGSTKWQELFRTSLVINVPLHSLTRVWIKLGEETSSFWGHGWIMMTFMPKLVIH